MLHGNPDVKYTKNKVNSFKDYSKIPLIFFNIILRNNESIWKLLKYDDIEIEEHEPDEPEYYGELDINKPNLTKSEKLDLLYKGKDKSDKYRVFLQPSTDDAEKEFNIKLKIRNYYCSTAKSNYNINGSNYLLHTIYFDIIVHNKYDCIDNGKRSRVDCIIEELTQLFLGMQIDGTIGEVFFNYDESRGQNKIIDNISNLKNYYGKTLSLSFITSELVDKSDVN